MRQEVGREKICQSDSTRVRTWVGEPMGFDCRTIQVPPINHSGMLPSFCRFASHSSPKLPFVACRICARHLVDGRRLGVSCTCGAI